MHNNTTLTAVQAVKLPFRIKVGYAVGNTAKALLAVSTAAFLLYFYTNVCGIDAKIASTIIMAAKIWDIINDPMMGAIVDRTVSPEGKCRYYLKRFAIPAGLIFVLSFFMPDFAMPGKVVWAAATYVLQGMASTVLLIPLNTLMGRITSDQGEQAKLSQYGNFFSLIGQYAVQGFMMKGVVALGGGMNVAGFTKVAAIMAVIYALLHLVVYWSTKGYEPVEQYAGSSDIAEGDQVKIPLSQQLTALLKNKMWLWIIVMFFCVSIGLYAEGATMQFYFQYDHGNDMSLYTLYSNISLAAAIVVILTLSLFVKKLGASKTAMLGCILCTVGYALRFILHDSSHLVMGVGWSLSAVGSVLVNATIFLLIFESKAWGLKKTGVNNDAILMSGFSVSYKTGSALGGAVVGFLMPAAYVAGAETQIESVQNFFFRWSTAYPCVAFAIGIIALFVIMHYERDIKEAAQ